MSKNQFAREGPASVALVIIPALAPMLDKSLKDDRTLCPVRALRYYLDKTKDLHTGKQLVFVSFKKNFSKDIVQATVFSWIKETILLCYQLPNEDGQRLHQFGPIMFMLLWLLRLFKEEFLWTRSFQPVIGSLTISSHNFICRMWHGLTLSCTI